MDQRVVILTYGLELKEFNYLEDMLKRILSKDIFIEQVGGFKDGVQETKDVNQKKKQQDIQEVKKDEQKKPCKNYARRIPDLEQLDWINGWY